MILVSAQSPVTSRSRTRIAVTSTSTGLGRVCQETMPGVEQQPAVAVHLQVDGAALIAVWAASMARAWLADATGRLMQRRPGRPATILASRRMAADSWNGARSVTAELIAVLLGAGATLLRSGMTSQFTVPALLLATATGAFIGWRFKQAPDARSVP
jgi:hypothetical protein